MKSLKRSLLAVSFIVLTAGAASASLVLSNTDLRTLNSTSTTQIAGSGNSNNVRWKSFSFTTPNTTQIWALNAVTLGLFGYNSTAIANVQITWKLYENSGTTTSPNYQPLGSPYNPGAGLIASYTNPSSFTVTAASALYNFTLSSFPNLTPNHNYSLVAYSNMAINNVMVAGLTGGPPNYTKPTVRNNSGFIFQAEERFWANSTTPPTLTWTSQNSAAFALDAHVVPEPSTYILLGMSLCVVGYARKRMVTSKS